MEILAAGRKPLRIRSGYGGSDGADRRPIPNLVVEARKYSALAVDTLVELTKDNHADSTRYAAATALLDRGYGRPRSRWICIFRPMRSRNGSPT